ncbi:fibrinogen-like protein A [Ruditapes philippinarum]|uniref:fibrinogen-like protein A n=1 Tax=Ruditapes philippinarum TaxID=129788 RepID=UPI00295B7095|nr:fibrinogen-like protein A [Ruditapes philippinarum]
MRTRGSPKSGVYTVNLWQSRRTINVYCDMSTDNGGWTVIQYRFDGSVDFYRNFSQYDNGFGDLSTEFWLGLRDIQELASQGLTDLRIELEAVNGSKGFETFEKFSLSSGPAYTFNVGATIGSLRISKWVSESVGPYHNGQAFSTYDHDVDKYGASCAVKFQGGWWYNSCYYANLNGPYITPGVWTEKAIRYKSFFDYRSLKSCKMMIRRR